MSHLIRSNLFSRGHPLKREPSLSFVLEGHLRKTLDGIKEVSDLARLTDTFLSRLVRGSLVEPLSIRFDQMTRSPLRSEQVRPGWVAQVARLSIPFTGDPVLLTYAPDPCGLTFPQGEVCDKTIQFDVIVGDAQAVKADIEANRSLIASCAEGVNRQARQFNESVPAKVKAAFDAKLAELTKQHAIFDDLGIGEEPKPAPAAWGGRPAPARPVKPRDRAVHIIQYVEAMYVQHLSQVNNNTGDVNNAISSGQ